MAEENILNGGVDKLEQIISDMQEHNSKVDRLDNINNIIRSLNKELENIEKSVKAEVDQKVNAATAAICVGYNKAIDDDKAKIKQVQVEREKAKNAGVTERISNETEALRKENEALKNQIEGAFKTEKIPMFANTRLFYALFAAREVLDYVIFIALDILVFIGVPVIFMFLELPALVYIVYYFIAIVIMQVVDHIIDFKLIIPNTVSIEGARNNRRYIANNKKKISSITSGIRSDKNEDMYDLGRFDYDINALHDHISKVEEDKARALEEFENNTKPDIVAEIEGRSKDNYLRIQEDVARKTEEAVALDDLVKQQRIYISSNYEAYLGREFMSLDKLQEMSGFMKSGIAETVGQAMAAYRDRH